MNLAHFVAERRASWERLDALVAQLERGRLDLAQVEELDRLFRRASADLARARTAFPGTEATLYLNSLAARAYAAVYRTRPRPLQRLRRFFGVELPLAFMRLSRFAAAAAALLVLGIASGAVSTAVDERVADVLAPPELVAGVRAGKMWTDDILSVAPPSIVSAKILTNNVGVTFTAFAVGIAGGLFTALLLLFNGFLVGSLGALCARHGLLASFLGFVLAHGVLELTVICLAGGAGLGLGLSLVDPGDLPRREALAERARLGARLVLGCAPALVFLGFVEGYVSPGDLFPLWAKALVGVALEVAFVGYLLRFGRAAMADEAAARAGTVSHGSANVARIRSVS